MQSMQFFANFLRKLFCGAHLAMRIHGNNNRFGIPFEPGNLPFGISAGVSANLRSDLLQGALPGKIRQKFLISNCLKNRCVLTQQTCFI